MAHIPDGVLVAPVLAGGALAAAGLLTLSLRRLDYEQLPEAAVLAAGFFVASLISIPLGPTSVHLLLNGLMGLILGWTAIPAICVALILQAAFFGFGGVLVLGVNLINMALPALACALLLRPLLARVAPVRVFWVGAAAGATGVLGTAALVASSLWLSGAHFAPAAKVLILSYLPLALLEGMMTGTIVAFLQRVEPGLLARPAVSRA